MGVMKRVQRIGKYMDYYDKEVVAGMKRVFAPRCSVLRGLEGWYKFIWTNPHNTKFEGSFKFSCNYNDILRAADSKHFTSCFRPEGAHRIQPLKRLLDPNWAVIIVPDKGGNVMARAWVQANALPVLKLPYSQIELEETFELYKRDSFYSWGYGGIACDCVTCRAEADRNKVRKEEDEKAQEALQRRQWEERIARKTEANRIAKEKYDEAIRARTESRKPYLNVSHVHGNNFSVDAITNALDSVAVWEVTSDIYL